MNELDILKLPGVPTFEEFCRNRDKYLAPVDDFDLVDKGSRTMKNVKRHVYEIEGYRAKSLEEVEKIASSQGIPIRELDYRPQIIPQGAGKCDIVVRFLPKHVRDKREAWD